MLVSLRSGVIALLILSMFQNAMSRKGIRKRHKNKGRERKYGVDQMLHKGKISDTSPERNTHTDNEGNKNRY